MKLIDLYSALKSTELEKFDRYLRKQIAQEQSQVWKLHSSLKAAYPNLEDTTINWIFLVVYDHSPTGEKLNKDEANRVRRVVNNLREHLERFIINGVRQNVIADLLALAEGYSKMGLYKLLPSIFTRIEREFKKVESQDLGIFLQRHTLQTLKFHHAIIVKNRMIDQGFQDLLNSLQDFLLCAMLRYSCAGQNRENILNVTYQYPLLEEVLSYLDKTPKDQIPAFATIYRHIFDLLKGDLLPGGPKEIMDLIQENEDDFSRQEQRQMYGFIANYLNNIIRIGNETYRKDLFDIYKFTLDKKIWTSGIHFSEHQFIYIVRNSLTLGENDWAVNFIQEYSKKLRKDYQQSIPSLAMAYVNFSNRDVEKAHQNLLVADQLEREPFYNYYYRVLQIQILYEQLDVKDNPNEREQQRLFGDIERFRSILEREIANKNKKKSTLNQSSISRFIRFNRLMRRIYGLRFDKLPEKRSVNILNNIKAAILEAEQLEERRWLLAKIERLNA